MRRVLAVARPYLPRLVGAGLLAAGAETAGLALLAAATWMLVTAAGQPPLHALTVAIVLVRATAISRGALRYTERLTGHDAVLRVLTGIRARIFQTLAATGTAGGRSGDVLSRLVSDVEAVQDLLLRVLVPGAAAAAVGVFAVAGAAVVAPAAAGVLAVGILLAGVALPAAALRLTRRTADQVAPLRGALAADAVDLTHGAADLAAFGATRTATGRASARAALLARLERRLAAAGFALDATGMLVAGATAAGVVVVAVRAGLDGALLGALAVGTLAAVESALALVGAARRAADIRTAVDRVAVLLVAPAAGPPIPPATPEGEVTVRLRAVRVSYRPGAAPALADVDLDLPPGRRVAVVGPSGAGKSTLVAVVAGQVPIDGGTVVVTDARGDLSAAGEALTPHVVGGLLAEAYVFHATVRDNLLLGRPDADQTQLMDACAAAGLAEWVHAQPRGWDTVVGEDGAQLSGGQRQRLALARALLAAPRVLVLDEPTEGLDPAAADRVLASVLAAAGPERAVLLVTHRLTGLASFDEIVVLDAGRVLQHGRHEDLAALPGWYREQWLAQQAAEHAGV